MDITREQRISRMQPLLKFLWKTKAVSVWEDGSTIGLCFNVWHPLSWIMIPVFFFVASAARGIPEAIEYSYEYGLGVSEYWKNNKRVFL